MGKIVLLAMVAAWAAVLIPPLFRSRVDNRPNSSIHDFRRHLSTLQRTVPTRQVAPMRAMARPLAHSGHTRATAKVNIDGRNVAHHATLQAPTRTTGTRQHGPREQDPRRHGGSGQSQPRPQRPARRPAPQISQREMLRRRRTNALVTLLLVTVVALFLAATTKATALLYVFAVAFIALGVYCYKLVQLRAMERNDGDSYYRAA